MNFIEFVLLALFLAYFMSYVHLTFKMVEHHAIANITKKYLKDGSFMDLAVINHEHLKGMFVLANQWVVSLWHDGRFTIHNNKGELLGNSFIETGMYRYYYLPYHFSYYRLKKLLSKLYVEKFGDNIVEFRDGKMVVVKSV